MRKNKDNKEINEIYEMLDFYLRHTVLGLLPFMDAHIPLPSSFDIAEVLVAKRKTAGDCGVKITGGRSLPEQQRIIEVTEPYTTLIDKYGIELMRKSFSECTKIHPDSEKLFRYWSQKGIDRFYTMADIAESLGYSDSSIPYKLRKKYLKRIAGYIYMCHMQLFSDNSQLNDQ